MVHALPGGLVISIKIFYCCGLNQEYFTTLSHSLFLLLKFIKLKELSRRYTTATRRGENAYRSSYYYLTSLRFVTIASREHLS